MPSAVYLPIPLCRYLSEFDDYSSIMVKAIADRLAEVSSLFFHSMYNRIKNLRTRVVRLAGH